MSIRLVCAMLIGVAVMFASGIATATTYSYTCTDTSGELQLRLNGTSAWTSASSGSTTAAPKSGDVIEINGGSGTACLGDIFVGTSGLTFTNHLDETTTYIDTDDIQGMFEVAGAHITIAGIALDCQACSPTTSNTTGISTFPEVGALALHDGASVILQDSFVGPSATDGIFVTRSSGLSVVATGITGNGTANDGVFYANGIFASDGSSVRLGKPDGSGPATIQSNGAAGGGCPGVGILLAQGSSLESYTATIGGVGSLANNCGQLLLQSGASARLEATTITQGDTQSTAAITATAGSSIIFEPNPNVAGASADDTITAGTTSASSSGAVLLAGSSTMLTNTATITATGTAEPAVEASTASSIILAGGNTISDSTSGATVLYIDHSSALLHQQAKEFGYASNATESITGKGNIQMQSSIDLGQGPIGGSVGAYGIVWTGNIVVNQNSSFRMEGGAHITGSVQISQQSNGFFNCNNSIASGASGASQSNNCGGSSGSPLSNAVDGTVECVELVTANENPSAHVANPTLVTPNVTVANLFGASSFASGTPAANTCLNF